MRDPAYHGGAPRRFEYDAGEGEHVLLESGRIGPVWCARDLWSRLPGGAHGVFVHPLTAFSPYYRTGIATPETTTATRAKLSDTNTDRERRRGGRQEDFARCCHDSPDPAGFNPLQSRAAGVGRSGRLRSGSKP